MILNQLRASLRTLLRDRLYSLVNLTGLTIGLCACMLVATIVLDGLSYDTQWSKGRNLYRIITVNRMGEGNLSRFPLAWAGLGPELKKDFPEVDNFVSFSRTELRFRIGQQDGTVAMKSLDADTSIWSMLDLHVVAGAPRVFEHGRKNLLISESVRDRFFHGKNPVGDSIQAVSAFDDKPTSYLISGVIRDLPANSHLSAEIVELRAPKDEQLYKKPQGSFLEEYLLLRPGTDPRAFCAKINHWYYQYTGNSDKYQFELQPIRDIHLRSDFSPGHNEGGDLRQMYIFSGVAMLLLLIACINFVNLSTARLVSRMRQSGIRKILGARRSHIMLQSLGESAIYFLLSTVLAVVCYELALAPVEIYLGHPFGLTLLSRVGLFAGACGVILLVCIFTGLYPAWALSGFSPLAALSGGLSTQRKSSFSGWLRKTLVVAQFSISIAILIAVTVVQSQVRHMKQADVGFDRNNLLSVDWIYWAGKGQAFKDALLETTGVERCSITSLIPPMEGGFMSREEDDPAHPGNKIQVWFLEGDPDLAATLGLRLREGRLLNPALQTDAFDDLFSPTLKDQPSLMTQTAAKSLGIRDIRHLPKNIYTRPVGVIQDIHVGSLKQPLGPTFILASRHPDYGGMLIRVRPGYEKTVTAAVQRLWKAFFPYKDLKTNWVDDLLRNQYKEETKLELLLSFFSFLTMALAALGVFGMAVHATTQRVKEIGVRRVLGASVASIVALLSGEFVRLVFISLVVGGPVAAWLMSRWLRDFAYRIHLEWWMFALAGCAAILIAVVTVGSKAVSAALVNPVKSLRTE